MLPPHQLAISKRSTERYTYRLRDGGNSSTEVPSPSQTFIRFGRIKVFRVFICLFIFERGSLYAVKLVGNKIN